MSLIGDRERERAALELQRHYLRGRLSVEELDRRVSVAVAARSSGDLGQALHDLPAPWRDAADELIPAAAAAGQRVRRAVVLLALAAVWAVGSLVLLLGLALASAVAHVQTDALAAVALLWAVLTYGLWRTGRRSL
ncbi:MAG: DUF1707 domain-containing protein [Gaiellaceae bacterium]